MKLTVFLVVAVCILHTVHPKSVGDVDMEFRSGDSEEINAFVPERLKVSDKVQERCTDTLCCPKGFICVDWGQHCFKVPFYLKATPC